MHTANVPPRSPSQDTLRDWAIHNSQQIALLRLALLLVGLVALAIVGPSWAETATASNAVGLSLSPGLVVLLPQPPILQDLIRASYYLLPALIAIFTVLSVGNEFLTELYNLRAPANGWRHIMSLMFGLASAGIYVDQGKLQTDGSNKAAQAIGGPAFLSVGESNAVLLERGAGFSRIVGAGRYRLRPHERVRGVIDLRTHYRKDTSKVLTKDGIPVKMEVDLTFRLAEEALPEDPPPSPPPPLGPLDRLRRSLGLTCKARRPGDHPAAPILA